MKDSLSKEHYCYKIHTLLMKSSGYLPHYIDILQTHPIWIKPAHFYKKILTCPTHPFYDFSKTLSPYK